MPRIFRKKGSSVYHTRFEINGQSIERTTGERHSKRASERAREIQAEARCSPPPSRAAAARGRLFDLSVDDIDAAKMRGVSEGERVTIRRRWIPLLTFLREDKFANDVTRDDLLGYEGYRRAAGIAGQTIRKELACLKRALTEAHRRGLVREVPHPWPTVATNPKDGKRGRLVPVEKIAAFLAALPSDLRDELTFDLLTGIRGDGELYRVTADWIEATPGAPTPALLRIPQSASKTREERITGVPAEALAVAKRRAKMVGRSAPLFTKADRRSIIGTAAKRAGLPFRPHRRDLRHTHGTVGAHLTGDARAVQAGLGHADLKQTETYLSSTQARTLAVAAAVAGAVFGTGRGRSGQKGRGRKTSAAPDSSETADSLSGARDWTRTSKVLPTGTSSHERHAVACKACAAACKRDHEESGTCSRWSGHPSGRKRRAG